VNVERWYALLDGLDVGPETDTFNQLQAAYSQSHRAYHTSRHIEECLVLLDELRHVANEAAEVEYALWFHDAVYKPMANDNEEKSADWAADFGAERGLPAAKVARIHAHIMATRHVALPTAGDSHLVVDIDLAILGATASRYSEFERDVRVEYRWVPDIIFRRKRAAILQSFLDRPRIYHWAPAFERFEQAARLNLSQAIQTLVG
jgi:predicted metal-dependent HD superfamily phosphohydrolase